MAPGAVHLILREHGARAQNHIGQLGMHAANGFFSRIRAERDLRNGQAAIGQRLAKGYRVGGVLYLDHRHDAGQGQLLDHFHGAFLLLFLRGVRDVMRRPCRRLTAL